jgi:hypothetical protein
MPKKHNSADEDFISQFAAQLKQAYENRSREISREAFAKSIGINSSSLQALLDGIRMPGVPTLALAVHHYDLDLAYEGTRFRMEADSIQPREFKQLTFPFVLSSLDPRISLKVASATDSTITLGVRIKQVS